MNITATLAQILTEIRRTRATVFSAVSNARTSSSLIVPNVDFIVDIFDRADSDSLGEYWTAIVPGVVIRSNQAVVVSNAGGTKMTTPVPISSSAFIPPENAELPNYLGTHFSYTFVKSFDLPIDQPTSRSSTLVLSDGIVSSSIQSNNPDSFYTHIVTLDRTEDKHPAYEYNAALTSPDFVGILKFVVPSTFLQGTRTAPYVRLSPAEASGLTNYYVSPLSSFGMFVSSSDRATSLAVSGVGFDVPAYDSLGYAYPASGTATVESSIAFRAASIFVGRLNSGNKAVFKSIQGIVSTYGNHFASAYVSPLVVGENILRFSVVGSQIEVSVNGVVVYSKSSASIIDRKRVGISPIDYDSVFISEILGIAYFGMTSFKVWRPDHAEPPDESGHGVIVNGDRIYSDKYHTRVNNAYQYNPNA